MNTKKTKKIKSLYIHIPFCKTICPYCDFTKFIFKDFFVVKYVEKLIRDLNFLIQNGYKFETIYIGGGTPSALSIKELKEILTRSKLLLNKKNYEFTIEANPESLDEEKLNLFKKCGVNRISIGVQTLNKSLLKSINRDFNVDIFNLIEITKKYIKNINIDLIYGLPNQTKEDLINDLNDFIKLDINHISTYSLSINPNSIFYVQNIKEVSQDVSREFYDLILNFLRKNGFERYEISNFARKGYESKHNLTYWNDEEYIGLGCGASGYIYPYRYKISSSLTDYIKGKIKIEKEIVHKNDDFKYFLICNLRKKEGFSLAKFKDKFGFNFCNKYKDIITKYVNSGFIKIENDHLFATDEGLITLDLFSREFM